MPVRSLFAAVDAYFKSRTFHTWGASWSVPTDEVFVSARLPWRHVDARGGVAEPWLLMAARSAAVKWRGQVCGDHKGRVRSVVIAGAGRLPLAPIRVRGAVHVTARYCGRAPDGAFRFRHGLCDRSGSEILHFVSQIYFSSPPDLPAYPAVKFDFGDGSEAFYQAVMRSTMADPELSDGDPTENSIAISTDTERHAATSGFASESVRIHPNSTVAVPAAEF